MLLDAHTFETKLTPEVALNILEDELKRKGWKKYKVHEIKLVYTPYWLFSFDVLAATGPAPTGKTALNAYSGEVNDFIPLLIERPLRKTRSTAEGVRPEIEPTSVSRGEVKETAATKIAAHVGALKPENVSVSAITKIYVPFYRVWVDVARDTFKVEVDAALGLPIGLEAIPEREKGWAEASGEALDKMKSPTGWAELGAKTVGSLAGAGKPGKPGVPGVPGAGGAEGLLKYAVLGIVILALLWFVFMSGFRQEVKCAVYEDYLSEPGFLGLGGKQLLPMQRGKTLTVKGVCVFYNSASELAPLILAQVFVTDKTNPDRFLALNNSMARDVPPGDQPAVKGFVLSWEDTGAENLDFGFKKL